MATAFSGYRDRIVRDREIMAGKPVVRGTRIPVELILQHLAENPDLDELFAAFPRLSREDVQACLDYARAAVEKTQLGRPEPAPRSAGA